MNEEKKMLDSLTVILNAKDIVVLGIDGLGGAGKSTVSEKLCDMLERNGIHAILLHIDDFIHTRAVRYNPSYPEWQCYYELQWRYDYFTETINRLKAFPGTSQEIELYDKEQDSYVTKQYSAEQNTVIIVEGIFLQRKELQGLFDYLIYIDAPEAVRLRRVLKRDTYIGDEQQIIAKYENRYFPAERRYFKEYRPDCTADLVIRK